MAPFSTNNFVIYYYLSRGLIFPYLSLQHVIDAFNLKTNQWMFRLVGFWFFKGTSLKGQHAYFHKIFQRGLSVGSDYLLSINMVYLR